MTILALAYIAIAICIWVGGLPLVGAGTGARRGLPIVAAFWPAFGVFILAVFAVAGADYLFSRKDEPR